MTNESLIYVPDITNYVCFVVQSEGIIRAYETMPTNNSSVNYRDYYIRSNYIYKDGIQTFSQYTTLPICLDSANLTNAYAYRNDFADICIIALILIGVVWFLVTMLIKAVFKGRKVF